MKTQLVSVFATIGLLLSTQAIAQECNNLDKNDDWLNGLNGMKLSLDDKDYENVLEFGRSIYTICPNSPVYLYYLARAFEGKGDVAKAREYIYKASDSTYSFATDPQIAQQIWYARYEFDYPERTLEAVNTLKAENEILRQRTDELQTGASQSQILVQQLNDSQTQNRDNLYVGTWTGAGIGIAGIALTIAGAVLISKDDEKFEVSSHQETLPGEYFPHKLETIDVKKNYTTGLALLGTGIGLTVAGSIVTGILGYRYTHCDDSNSVSVGLNHIAFSMKF